jgi:hypothetical protein
MLYGELNTTNPSLLITDIGTSGKMLSTFVIVSSAIVATLVYIVTYRIFFHPLSSVPGPILARLTKLWLVWHVRKGKSHIFMPNLHKTYGPIVRIAPNEVLVRSEDGVRLAYGAGTKFTKGAWYQAFAAPKRGTDEDLDLLTEINMEKYRMQRRAIGPAYSVAGMEKHEGLLDRYNETYITKIKSFNGKEVDLAEWMHIYALDALSWFTLSTSLDYTAKGHDGGNLAASDSFWSCFTTIGLFPIYVDIMHSIPKIGGLLILPAGLLLGLGVPKSWPVFGFVIPQIMSRLKALESTRDVKMLQRTGTNRGFAQQVNEQEEYDESNEKDLLATLMNLHHNKEAKFRPTWVLGITMTNFGAGHDTIMITLAACVYNLATHPTYVTRLRQEMVAHGITKDSRYTDTTTKVPLYSAILKESLRLYPAVSFYMPRVVPAGGVTICNTYLPPKTTMGINLWATHRDPNIFVRPDEFVPDRWLHDGSVTKKKEIGRLDQFWLGSGGQSRSCPGQNLGRFFVIKVLAKMVEEFDMECVGKPEFTGWFATGLKGVGVKFTEMS